MEDLLDLYEKSESYNTQLEHLTDDFMTKLRGILWGATPAALPAVTKEKQHELPIPTPQQTKKRAKRLSSLREEDSSGGAAPASKEVGEQRSPGKSRRSNAELLASAAEIQEEVGVQPNSGGGNNLPETEPGNHEPETVKVGDVSEVSSSVLMPPPSAPLIGEHTSGRPQRAAKLKSEKNLKEPKLNNKLRRPSGFAVKVKLEHEQRPSQMHEETASTKQTTSDQSSKASLANSTASNESLVVLPGKTPETVVVNSSNSEEDDKSLNKADNQKEEEIRTEQKKISEEPNSGRQLRVKIKREKVSLPKEQGDEAATAQPLQEDVFKVPQSLPLPITVKNEPKIDECSMTSSTLSTTSAGSTKKGRKKKDGPPHRPIKVERFSDIEVNPSPISSRTRKASTGRSQQQQERGKSKSPARPASIYEDAEEMPPPTTHEADGTGAENVNKTVTIAASAKSNEESNATLCLGPAVGDATFCTNPTQVSFQVAPGQTTFIKDPNLNATVTLSKNLGNEAIGDATFNVTVPSKDEGADHRSFETAKDASMPQNESLITEDESCEPEPSVLPVPKPRNLDKKIASATEKTSALSNVYKMPTRTNELFNPLLQSPVKLRVEAFENVAQAAAKEQTKRAPGRPKHIKENAAPGSTNTPVVGKLQAPVLGRFLTPTQTTNITPTNSAVAKKLPTSASKALPMPKSSNASSLKVTTSASKALHRENSADDFRKGLHQLAEERKKQREQKHVLAAQQREAKERERAERMAKLAKEREEKRIKKQMENEQKKRELEEIQRKLRQQEEAAAAAEAAKQKAAKAKTIMEQERELLLQMKQQQSAKQRMLPPPPKVQTKYTFEMLHEDDSTDDEGKTSYKRPPPPSWSRSQVRGAAILMQQYWPTDIIDSFFSVQPMTPDLQIIFPNIDSRFLKRNSSVLWSTPPRYSELPKY